MLRIYIPIAFILLFICWVFYRILIRKDLRENYNTLFIGLFFISIWTLIYLAILKN